MAGGEGKAELGERLMRALKLRKTSQSDLAVSVKVTRGAVGQWKTGATAPSTENLMQIAAVLRVRFEWLATGRGPMELSGSVPPRRAPELRQVPLLSWVSAGDLADAQSQIPVEDVPLLAFADLGRGEFFALRVEGDSMDRYSPDGSIIVVNRADRELSPGRCYVFSMRGETTYKVWQPEPARLTPYSTNPVHQPIFIKRQKDIEVVGRVRRSVLEL